MRQSLSYIVVRSLDIVVLLSSAVSWACSVRRHIEVIALTLVKTLYSQLRTCCWTTIVVPLAIFEWIPSGHDWYDSHMQSTSAEAVRANSFKVSYLNGLRSVELGFIHLPLGAG